MFTRILLLYKSKPAYWSKLNNTNKSCLLDFPLLNFYIAKLYVFFKSQKLSK